jgi:hypothetical protein
VLVRRGVAMQLGPRIVAVFLPERRSLFVRFRRVLMTACGLLVTPG